MGYDVHITRADDWLDADKAPITLEQWLQYVEKDSELRLDNVATARVDGEPAIAYENAGLAVWIAFSGHDEEGNMAWMDHRDYHIVVKNPDEEILTKMKAIAAALDAKVIGDDGEEY